jgi:hypothetical protein
MWKTNKIRDGEKPIESINAWDLLMQFKVMKALNYKSLFDADFRREMQNPTRRLLYYRLVLLDETVNRKFLIDSFKSFSDRIGFYSNPGVYKKVKEEEEREELLDPETRQVRENEARDKYEQSMKNYVPMSEKEVARQLSDGDHPIHSMQ